MTSVVRRDNSLDISPDLQYSYRREADWGTCFPDANGENQSPIDINSRTAEFEESLNETGLTLTYHLCRETIISNNGHTVACHMKYKPGDGGYGKEQAPKSALSGGPLGPNNEYVLDNFRFHWGRQDDRGSEHTVNFKAFPMELQLLHYNSTLYASVEDAIGKPDGVAIVALFIMNGQEHPGVKVLIEQLSDLHYKDSQKTVSSVFNPNCLLPDPMLRDFWTYQGSLTSPPCSENVTWIIFRYPLTFSHGQIEEFRRLRMYHKGESPDVTDCDDGALVDNFRPTQQINDRIVRASFQ